MWKKTNRPLIPLRLPLHILCQGCPGIPRPLHNILTPVIDSRRRGPLSLVLCTCLHLKTPDILALALRRMDQETSPCAISKKTNNTCPIRNLIPCKKLLIFVSSCHRLKIYPTLHSNIAIPPLLKSPSHRCAGAPSVTHGSSLSSLLWSGLPFERELRFPK